jgi:hypothetical protein
LAPSQVEALLDITLPDQEGEVPVPDDLRQGYREALLTCGAMARAAAAELELRIDSARTVVAAVLLSDGRPAAADLVHRAARPWLEVERPRCRSLLWAYVELESLEMQRASQILEHVPGPRKPRPTGEAPSPEISPLLET